MFHNNIWNDVDETQLSGNLLGDNAFGYLGNFIIEKAEYFRQKYCSITVEVQQYYGGSTHLKRRSMRLTSTKKNKKVQNIFHFFHLSSLRLYLQGLSGWKIGWKKVEDGGRYVT